MTKEKPNPYRTFSPQSVKNYLKTLSRKEISTIFRSLLTPPLDPPKYTDMGVYAILSDVASVEGFVDYLTSLQHSHLIAHFEEETPEGRLLYKGRYELASELIIGIRSANEDLLQTDIEQAIEKKEKDN